MELVTAEQAIGNEIKAANFPVSQKALDEMSQIMYTNKGVGLAAPQVGIYEAFFIMKLKTFHVVCNPFITVLRRGITTHEEGCLTLPDYRFVIPRWDHIRLIAQDEIGKQFIWDCIGTFARVIQHEVDHLRRHLINGQDGRKP